MKDLVRESEPFLQFLEEWVNQLPDGDLDILVPSPDKAALFSVDMTNGFCRQGNLASPRVGAIVSPVVDLIEKAWHHGINDIVLLQDNHEPEAIEFGSFPAHCVVGTSEAEAIDEIKALPFYKDMLTIYKNSVSSDHDTRFLEWVQKHPETETFLVVGDCTDICVYLLAISLHTHASARQVLRKVIVPMDCVDTYDYTIAAAKQFGGLPHPGDLMHAVFLYHLALNGVQIVKTIKK